MAGLSLYLKTTIINSTLRGTAFTAPSVVYLGLFITDPGEGTVLGAPEGLEVSSTGGSNYTRVPISFDSPTNGKTQNTLEVRFPLSGLASGEWGTVTHFAIFDSNNVSTGKMLYSGKMEIERTISTGDIAILPPSSIAFEII